MGLLFHGLMICILLLVMSVFSAGLPVCNPMLVYVVYLGLRTDFFPGFMLVVISGFLVDGLSGAPLGLFFFTFLWVFCLVRWLSGFLRTTSPLFFLLAVLSGILLENFFTFLVLVFGSHGQEIWFIGGRFLLYEMLSALILSPLLLMFFRKLHSLFVGEHDVTEPDHGSSFSVVLRR